MSAPTSTSEPSPRPTEYYTCPPSEQMFTSHTLAAAHVRTAPEHAAALASAADPEAFISSVIVVMEMVPDIEGAAIWRAEFDKGRAAADKNDPLYEEYLREMPSCMCVLRPKVDALPEDVPAVKVQK